MSGSKAARALAGVHASFAWALYRQQSRVTPENLVISPFSVSMALAMTLVGARGTTATAMREALRSTGIADLDAAFAALLAQLRLKPGNDAGVLHIANALWVDRSEPLADTFVQTLSSRYAALAEALDFTGASEAARQRINQWVAQQTMDQIPELLGIGAVDQARVVLTNALYFRAAWLEPFSSSRTQPLPFHADGREFLVPTMTLKTALRIAKHPQWTAVELPYADPRMTMTLVLPRGELHELEAALAPDWLERELKLVERAEVGLLLPRFSSKWTGELRQALCELGMAEAFDARADFSGIAPGLVIDRVVHAISLTADEQGTVAAAATGMLMPRGAPLHFVRVAFDRPFLFVIRHAPSGAVLFMGRIVDPRSS